jgi:tetratricopeptide (TPR) repeat protein
MRERTACVTRAAVGFIDLVFGDRSEKKRALLERARRFFRQGRVDKALEHAERGLKLDPDGADSRETLGRLYFRMGMLAWADGAASDAIECFKDADALLKDPLVLFYRGLVYRDTRQHHRAIDDFSRILRSEEIHVVPLATYATFCRALCYRENGEHKFAAKDFTTCLLSDPGSPLKHRFLAHRALCRASLGETAGAQEDLLAAEAIAPHSAEVAQIRAALAKITPPLARPALPAARSLPTAVKDPGGEPPPFSTRNEELIATEREMPAFGTTDWDDESTGRRLMPSLGTHVGRSRGHDDEPSDPSETDWTLIPDSSPMIPRPDASPTRAPVGSITPSPLEETSNTDGHVQKRQNPHPGSSIHATQTSTEDAPETQGPVARSASPGGTAHAAGIHASSESSAGAGPAAAAAAARLDALKHKREQAFAERELLFGDTARSPSTKPAIGRNAAPAATSPPATASTVRETAAPAPTAGPSSEGKTTRSTKTAPAAPLSDKARRCLRKLDEMLTHLESEPAHFDDVDFCVDYLLVVARLRELPRPEKKALVRLVGTDALRRYEQAESRARTRLQEAPIAASASDLAKEVAAILEQAPPPARVPGSDAEPALRAFIERFQAFNRAQKYLFMSRCGEKRFARFIDYFVALGGAESA